MEDKPVDFYSEKDIFGLEKPDSSRLNNIDNEWNRKTPEVQKEKEDPYRNFEFPPLITRVKALTLDVLIMIFVFIITAELISFMGGAPGWFRGAIFIFMMYLYEPILVSSIGGTLGHYAMGLRVRSIKNPKINVFILFALFRFFLKGLLGWLSFLTIARNKQRRAIHDLWSNSIVIIKMRHCLLIILVVSFHEIQAQSTPCFECAKAIFIVDNSGSVDSQEYTDMKTSIGQISFQLLNNDPFAGSNR